VIRKRKRKRNRKRKKEKEGLLGEFHAKPVYRRQAEKMRKDAIELPLRIS